MQIERKAKSLLNLLCFHLFLHSPFRTFAIIRQKFLFMADLDPLQYFHIPAFDHIFNSPDFQNATVESGMETTTATHQSEPAGQTNDSGNETSLISDLALIFIAAGIMTILFKRLKQPVVLGYIVAGFLVGPHFSYFPSVVDEANVDFWAELGIIFLLFSLGLEFSFKKLLNVGGSAAITALVIIIGMMTTGFFAGKLMGFSFISSLFLGGMLSMSSTTIVLKALNDLRLMHRRFVSQVLAVLIVEDLFAVVLMVLLSSIAVNNSVSGDELFWSIGKLLFFLVLWFVIGVYLIPSFLEKQRKFLTDELLLLVAVGLCFLMVILSSYTGFSTALGAFVMGSILAGTSEAERIEKIISPVKDLFGALFFVSVGMMVNPQIIATYTMPIIGLSALVIIGMIVFGTVGMLVTGQPLRVAIQSGFSLTQIGEFSFIIATLGMSLGVIDSDIYPIIVAVSVITTFFTPYFIKLSEPFSTWIESKIPEKLLSLISRYSASSARNEPELGTLWKQIAKRNVWRILLYSVLLIAIMFVSSTYLKPVLLHSEDDFWGKLIYTAVTITVMSPFLLALCYPSTKKWEREKLRSESVRSNMPFIAIRLVRVLMAFGFIVFFILTVYSHVIAIVIALSLFIFIAIYFSKSVRKHMRRIESQFYNNLHERELRRSGRNTNLVSDMHLAYITVGYDCPFVGEMLGRSNIGKLFGVNVASIQRGEHTITIPDSKTRIFPGDTLGVIGNDEQIQQLLNTMETPSKETQNNDNESVNIEFTSIVLSEKSPIAGKRVADANLRKQYSAMLVSVEHSDGSYENPTGDTVLNAGDNLWLVGDAKKVKLINTNNQ